MNAQDETKSSGQHWQPFLVLETKPPIWSPLIESCFTSNLANCCCSDLHIFEGYQCHVTFLALVLKALTGWKWVIDGAVLDTHIPPQKNQTWDYPPRWAPTSYYDWRCGAPINGQLGVITPYLQLDFGAPPCTVTGVETPNLSVNLQCSTCSTLSCDPLGLVWFRLRNAYFLYFTHNFVKNHETLFSFKIDRLSVWLSLTCLMYCHNRTRVWSEIEFKMFKAKWRLECPILYKRCITYQA